MLTPISRFQFNKMYLYGSAAFVTGFAGVLALLIHFVPVRVADTNASNLANIQTTKKESAEVAPATEEAAAAADTSPMQVVTTPDPTQPVVEETPVVETPTVPDVPVVPVDPVIPPIIDPIVPPVEIPVIETPDVSVSISL